MKLLAISNDKKIFDPSSAVARRQIEYAKNYEEMHILIRGESREITLAPNLWVYGSYWRYGLARFLIEKRKITHVTCQDPFENGLIGMLLKKRHDIHLELQIHTEIPYQSWWRQYLAKYELPFADNVRVVSNRIKEYVSKFTDKIEVRPIFVDVEKIKNAPITLDLRQKYLNYKKRVLMVSRLEKEKRVDMAIKAFADMPDKALIIVGDGSQRQKLEKMATHNVYFEGWQDPITYYKTADIFLNTSLYEGYGMSLVEAKAANLRILSTDVGVAKEIGAEIINSSQDIIKNI